MIKQQELNQDNDEEMEDFQGKPRNGSSDDEAGIGELDLDEILAKLK